MRELLFFFIFIFVLVIVTYGLRDPQANNLKKSLSNLFFPPSFSNINNVDDYQYWLTTVLLPGLRADRWYNGEAPIGQRGFISDRVNRIMGYATMRQIRIKSDSCADIRTMKAIFLYCKKEYYVFNEDNKSYVIGWKETLENQPNTSRMKEFLFTKEDEQGSYSQSGIITTYSGGGYVHGFRENLNSMLTNVKKLRDVGWIDIRTQAILIEFAVYNPASNLFGLVRALVEFTGSGGITTSYRIEPANLLGFLSSNVKAFELAIQIVFVLCLFGIIVKEIRNLKKKKILYFYSFQSLSQIFIVCGSFSAIGIYIYVTVETKRLALEFYRSNGNGYVNFQRVSHLNENLCYLASLIIFAITLNIMHILRFNRHISILSSVLLHARKSMAYFLISFSIVFFTFVITFFVLFYRTLRDYSTFILAAETNFQIVLGKFDVKVMSLQEPILGPLLFAAFSLFIVFIMLSMFVAILTDSFEAVRKDPNLQLDDHEMMQFLLVRFILWFGLSSSNWGQKILKGFSENDIDNFLVAEEDQNLEERISDFDRSIDMLFSSMMKSH